MGTEKKVLFECEGRPVYFGDVLHVAPVYHYRAGATVTAYREAFAGEAVCRSPNGAVPIVPITALSWAPHPETQDREALRQQLPLGQHITDRDLRMWRLGREAGLMANQATSPNADKGNCAEGGGGSGGQ